MTTIQVDQLNKDFHEKSENKKDLYFFILITLSFTTRWIITRMHFHILSIPTNKTNNMSNDILLWNLLYNMMVEVSIFHFYLTSKVLEQYKSHWNAIGRLVVKHQEPHWNEMSIVWSGEKNQEYIRTSIFVFLSVYFKSGKKAVNDSRFL